MAAASGISHTMHRPEGVLLLSDAGSYCATLGIRLME